MVWRTERRPIRVGGNTHRNKPPTYRNCCKHNAALLTARKRAHRANGEIANDAKTSKRAARRLRRHVWVHAAKVLDRRVVELELIDKVLRKNAKAQLGVAVRNAARRIEIASKQFQKSALCIKMLEDLV